MHTPEFSFKFFHPRYWINWIGLAILYLISWLPYRLQLSLGKLIGRLLYTFVKSRRKIAKRNLEICFPDMPAHERQQLLIKNFESTGIALFESSMGWWWPKWRIQRLAHYEGVEHLTEALESGKGVLLVTYHMMCLEICGRVFAQKHPCVAFYRPHNNPLMEYFQYNGRARDNKYLIGAKNVKGLLEALANNEACHYLPDQDYGRRRSVFVPFFAEPQACTTTGTTLFAKEADCKVIVLMPERLANGKGYKLTLTPALDNYPSGDDEADAARLNQLIETGIMKAPEQYMWLHRRFKTRPDKKQPSVYK
ncbi:LpxL/LpxP family Kdo(2)-lipid IV(A) lauroyl/palmitoleoyl acyltransferase [Catenovulum sp. 2E275]|uniref:LpxL/LpxP family Kdo(2)-lipid IV(A) lauroyl/palmitoleoyl acyltransferase n=1 Tax=Catenovulum sp. 2E275 TaxID=2980497 RepID=UPI0021CFD3FC|nr:LpxL/LpxP family Kdo(2)-lipid IV(A) lauroyl/palmitoleoyl acyltransferase [Catenovulum sp. 2E275]MCU4676897.1 LpxL/LpxP family Kdo(2)-lipid IV(A) lauroyl/palmitoleoyl acyltransferase [Catenovulum sp. 2E275]